ncbi:WXG100 family type VII secretion target [Protaetiibacter intestinalis]|uniref:ESAT-6-like protein n=2 Tax=Protaetiibacter intestinalis TaxID=2419774 RepID=A0A387BCP5_9MICO|nr:WXG100 family type VII secretion target [Protaetiibacter intestinalis]
MSVDPAQVSALAAQIRNGASGIKSQLDTLESEVGKLRASWSGEAQTSYDQAQAKWTKSLGEMQQLLEQIASKTDEISSQYTQTDKSAAGRFAL